MPSLLVLSVLAASVVVTSFISGILGMAGGMILMGVLLAFMPVPAAMMLHGITQLASNGWRAFMWRNDVDWRVFRGYVYGALAALAIFAAVRLVVSKPVALILMGLTPFITLWLPEGVHLNVERRGQSTLCGLVCGAISLTTGVSGPILAIFFVRSRMLRKQVVATKAMTQTFSHVMKIVYFGTIASLTGGAVPAWVGAIMVLLAIGGTTLSGRFLERWTEASFRAWTRWTVVSLGCFYLADGVVMLLR